MEYFDKQILEEERLKFGHLKDKKILIYGSGKNARLLIEALHDFNIVGIIDRFYFDGSIQNIPIIIWDEVNKNTADVLIIASSIKNFREIFLRIKHYCTMFNLDVYNILGQELSAPSYYSDYTYQEMKSLNCSKKDLFDIIDKYDAISFDLFDTLIMRKVMEPVDIFDIVERKICKYDIIIKNFKKKRRMAELNSNGGDIFSIYRELKKNTNLSDEQLSFVMEEELACERDNIIIRECMVEAFNYALKKGKTVSIISNMYLTTDIIQDILNNIGIKGWDNLFISCEYGKGKSEGLFEIYKEKIGNNTTYLHIGDDCYEDILSAEKNGIATFYVNSSLELFKMSKIRNLLFNSHGFENRLFIGLIISKLFNNPFILYNTNGFISISHIKIFAEVFIAPVVYVYMKKLLECIHNNQFDGVIFPARDGYIFFHLYEKYKKNDCTLPKSYYLTISRKIAVAISQYDYNDIFRNSKKCLEVNNNVDYWKEVMHFNANDVEGIIKESKEKRNMYIKYMEKMDIDLQKNYLFCELVSDGTTHYALSKIFFHEIDGFYLSGFEMMPALKNLITHIYPFGLNNVNSRTDILEAVLSSPKPSAGGIDCNGDIFYELEERTQNEINMMLEMHNYIENFIEEYEAMCENIDIIDLNLLDNLMSLFECVNLDGEMKHFTDRCALDTMSLQKISIMRKR